MQDARYKMGPRERIDSRIALLPYRSSNMGISTPLARATAMARS